MARNMKEINKEITLSVFIGEPDENEPLPQTIRLDEEAAAVIMQLRRQTGLDRSYIASQMIIQGFPLTKISCVKVK